MAKCKALTVSVVKGLILVSICKYFTLNIHNMCILDVCIADKCVDCGHGVNVQSKTVTGLFAYETLSILNSSPTSWTVHLLDFT